MPKVIKMEGPFACEWDELLSEGLELQYLSQSAPPRPSPEFEELGGVGNYPVSEPMLVVVGRVPTALELQDFS